MSNSVMSSPTNYSWLITQLNSYLPSRLTPIQLDSLTELSPVIFKQLSQELNDATTHYNKYPKQLTDKFSSSLFLNTNHLKTLLGELPTFSTTLGTLSLDQSQTNLVFTEMRDSTYFNFIYKITNPHHLLANLMTLVYRCHMLTSHPKLRQDGAQISSTLEEMSALRYVMGSDSLHHQATRHWILDWEGEGFSRVLATRLSQ